MVARNTLSQRDVAEQHGLTAFETTHRRELSVRVDNTMASPSEAKRTFSALCQGVDRGRALGYA